jgi:membrane associated rhomboid family serine protease
MIPLRDYNPTGIVPVVTIGIIVACVLVFLWEVLLPRQNQQAIVYSLGLVPAVLTGRVELAAPLVPPVVTVFTSMFLHGGWLHVGGNMLYLWIFGDNIEDRLGHGRYIAFYLLCGVAAALAQTLPDVASRVPMIGASGAISGILGAYLVLYPRANVLVGLPIFIVFYTFRVPALLVLGFWFLAQLLSSLVGGAGGGVAFRAHVGGFVTGVLLIRLFLLGRRSPRAQ